MGYYMVDWNNDGHIGADDLLLTDIILEEEKNNGSGNKPRGSCLTTLVFMISISLLLLIVFTGII